MDKTRIYLVKELRKCAAVQGKQATWASKLDDQHLFDVFIRLKNGATSQAVARHLMDKHKIRTTSTLHAVSQGITKLRRRISHLLIAPVPQEDNVSQCREYTDADCCHSPIASMENLAANLQRRIQTMLTEEQETGLRNPALSKEILALVALKKGILREKTWQSKYGDKDPVLLEQQR